MHRADLVAEGEALARLQHTIGHEGADDVVGGFVLGRKFDQLDLAGAPVMRRLDPVARALLLGQFDVGVILEVAVALHQAETAGIGVEKAGCVRLCRIA